jgi:capsular polysaccharide biosynthesis protein
MNLSAIAHLHADCPVSKVEEAIIPDNLNRRKMANISVIQVAAILQKSVKLKKALSIALGITLGAVSGRSLGFFSEYANQGLSTPESGERRLGLLVLRSVPYKEEE